jgi:hypothetical protein
MASAEEIAAFLDESALIWLLHITGGEQFVYPRYTELSQRLARVHFSSVNSNLSLGGVKDFTANDPPKAMSFVNCGPHSRRTSPAPC